MNSQEISTKARTVAERVRMENIEIGTEIEVELERFHKVMKNCNRWKLADRKKKLY